VLNKESGRRETDETSVNYNLRDPSNTSDENKALMDMEEEKDSPPAENILKRPSSNNCMESYVSASHQPTPS
jgi:hypothetical protein